MFKTLFYPVANSADFKDGLNFHKYYFVDNNGFLYGLLLALAVAVIVAAVYYFGLARNVAFCKTKFWWVSLICAFVISFFGANFALIGTKQSKPSISFYQNIEDRFKDQGQKKNMIGKEDQYRKKRSEIIKKADKWGDVRLSYDLTCGVWAIIFFVGSSAVFKRFSPGATQIPW